ncbi:MAG TPA: GGDEF domain-containing protein [Actinomycetota bacterium]|nr:GGDEF domain-containing protein [Actinomycetota bacterium]
MQGAVFSDSPRRKSIRHVVVEQLRVMLEERSTRFVVVGALLLVSSLSTLVPSPAGIDLAWMFIVPVAVSAIAGGLREGLLIAGLSAVISALYATAARGEVDPGLIVNLSIGRLMLYGITAGVLGAFAEAHQSLQAHLRQLATLDPLTKLSNVARFYDELGIMEAGTAGFAVMLVDVDDLKVLNDRYGHQAGSAAIQHVANALRRVVRGSDCVARFGGDEFVVILKDSDRVGAGIVANRLREVISEERFTAVPEHEIKVSIGVALFEEDGITSEDLLEVADRSMYADKKAHKGVLVGK